MNVRTVSLYGGLLLLCQLVLSCSSENNPAQPNEQMQSVTKGDTTPDQNSIKSTAQTRQILAFGDSLYAGYNLGPKEGLVPVLQSKLRAAGHDIIIRNAAVSGDTSAGGLRRLTFVLDGADEKIDLVMLGLGGNDMLRGVQPAETRANLDKMLAELKQRDIDVILTGMLAAPNLGQDYAREFDIIYPQLAQKYGAGLYPFIMDGVVANPALMLNDNIHPNAQGVEKITEGLLPLVEARLE